MADPTGKHSKASKERWAKIPAEERSKRMSEIAKIRHKSRSKEELSLAGKRMRAAHKKK